MATLTTDEGLCIRVWDWSETSQTVSIFGRASGIVRAVAKGSKRENNTFSGGLEVLTRAEFMASIKLSDQMSTLTSWDLHETFPAARRSLSAFYAGMAMLDLIHHSIKDHDPHPQLWDSLLAALRSLGTPQTDRAALLAFLWAVLSETGHRPELTINVANGEELTAAKTYVFSARLGGVTTDTRAPGDGAWRVRAETIDLLRSISAGSGVGPAKPEPIDRATRLLALYFREVFACDLPSLRQWIDQSE